MSPKFKIWLLACVIVSVGLCLVVSFVNQPGHKKAQPTADATAATAAGMSIVRLCTDTVFVTKMPLGQGTDVRTMNRCRDTLLPSGSYVDTRR